MTIIESLILGILQGITEFLPISSSGHLVLLQNIWNIKENNLFLNVILHLGSFFAIVLFFRKKIWESVVLFHWKKNPLLLYVVLASVPTAFIGLLIKKYYALFSLSWLVGLFLIINGILLFCTRFVESKNKEINLKIALLIGIMQGIAALPGISRSGSTVSLAFYLGIDKEKAFDFSFILVLPAILGATLLEILEIMHSHSLGFDPGVLVVGFFSSFFFGILSLFLLKKIIVRNYFYQFGYYCVGIGILSFVLGVI